LLIGGSLLVLLLVSLGTTAFLLWRVPGVQGWVMVQFLQHQRRQPTENPHPPSLAPEEARLLTTNTIAIRSAADLFCTTNVWNVRLKFGSNQWAELGPNAVPPVPRFIQPEGTVILRNPKASRNGLAGVLGIDFPWSDGDLEFGDSAYSYVGVRFKGNGTFVESQGGYKRPFKIALNRHMKSYQIAGRTDLNLHNLTADPSCLSDTLAYEFFRAAGVPASRTAFARLCLTVQGRFDERLLGLYLLVENIDGQWAKEHFGIENVSLFKPVTYELFHDLGNKWDAYEGIYDPKTKIKAKQRQRLIDLSRLVTHASDAEFAERIGDFIDLDEFACFLAGEVLLSNYDGILSNGQNFYLYLDPRTERFGFIPWDLDHSWGEFPLIGSREEREQASLWHPWVGDNRFLERMLAAAPVRKAYRRELERLRATAFVPEDLSKRLDELATLVRPFIVEESSGRLSRFERQVADFPVSNPVKTDGPNRGTRVFKRFFKARAQSVSDQLEGRSEGVIIQRRRP